MVTSVPFKVSLNDDNILEENENFVLTINQSSLASGVTIGNPSMTTVTIVDNDRKLYMGISSCDTERKTCNCYAKQKHLGCKKGEDNEKKQLSGHITT